jgi:hypothetical protein
MLLPDSGEPLDLGAGIPSKALVRIVEIDGDVVEFAASTAQGEIDVITNLRQEGQDLVLSNLHIDGPGARTVGLMTLRNLARVLGEHYHVSRVIVYGSARRTGANPGHSPQPIIFDVGGG